MTLRRMMLRRKTDPKTGKHTLREPAQMKRTHMDMSQEPFCVEIHRNDAGPQFRDLRFVRACAVEMHMDISQEPFCVVIYIKKSRTRIRPPRLNTGPFTLTVRTPSVWPHCVGKKRYIMFEIQNRSSEKNRWVGLVPFALFT